MSKDVSIVIAAYNAERCVGRAIESLLCQELPVEVVVVDDGSADRTAQEAARFAPAVKVVRQGNRGPSAARNRGMLEASGAFVGFLDADDEALPGMALVLRQALVRHPDAWGASGAHIYRSSTSHRILPDPAAFVGFSGEPLPDFFEAYRRHRVVCTGSVLLRREGLEAVGGFREDLRFGEDLDLWSRVAGRRPWCFVNTPVCVYNHAEATSTTIRTPEAEKPIDFLLGEAVMRASIRPELWGSYRKYRRDMALRQARGALHQGARTQACRLLSTIHPAPINMEWIATRMLCALPAAAARSLLATRGKTQTSLRRVRHSRQRNQ